MTLKEFKKRFLNQISFFDEDMEVDITADGVTIEVEDMYFKNNREKGTVRIDCSGKVVTESDILPGFVPRRNN